MEDAYPFATIIEPTGCRFYRQTKEKSSFFDRPTGMRGFEYT
jgi:hypothetical protein